jgi:ribosome-associated protein
MYHTEEAMTPSTLLSAIFLLSLAVVYGWLHPMMGKSCGYRLSTRRYMTDQEQRGDSIEKNVPRTKKMNKRDRNLEQILDSVEFVRHDHSKIVPLNEDPMIPIVEAAVIAADNRKAKAIEAFRISHLTEITTFMVIVEGNSKPQNQAIASAIEDDLLEKFNEEPNKEGDPSSGWMLLDYSNLIVHIMTPQMRNFYKIEKRWKDKESLDIAHLIIPEGGSSVYNSEDDAEFADSSDEDTDESDPFWQ